MINALKARFGSTRTENERVEIPESNLEELREMTESLPKDLTEIIAVMEGDTVVYDTLKGTCVGVALMNFPDAAVQRAYMPKGSIIREHCHDEWELIVVYKGKLKCFRESKTTIIKIRQFIVFPNGELHTVEALEDTRMVGITIPASAGYPRTAK